MKLTTFREFSFDINDYNIQVKNKKRALMTDKNDFDIFSTLQIPEKISNYTTMHLFWESTYISSNYDIITDYAFVLKKEKPQKFYIDSYCSMTCVGN